MSTDPRLTRRNLLRATATGAAAAAVGPGLAFPQPASAAPFVPYPSSSYFKTPVAGMTVNAARTTAFTSFMKTHPDQRSVTYPTITGQSGNPWGTSTHVSAATDPIWRFKSSMPRPEGQVLATQGVHLADDVARRIPVGSQDREMLVVDTVFGYSVFAGNCVADLATRTITCAAVGITWHSSNGLDRRNPLSNDTRNWTSRGRLSDAGVIRPDLVRSGVANGTGLGHVLQMWFVETLSTEGHRHPMVGHESSKYGWGAEGERIALRPDLDLAARGLTDAALVVARTLQTHGCYIGDNSGSGSTLKGAQSTSTYQPYAGTNLTRDCLKGKITWDDFVVLSG